MRARAALVLVVVATAAVVIAIVLRSGDEPVAAPNPTAAPEPASTTATTEPTPDEPDASSTTTTREIEATTTRPPVTTLAPGTTACDAYGSVEALGMVAGPQIVEASGLVQGRVNEGILWTHNDSRDGPRLYAVGFDGSDLGGFQVGGALAFDWEDIAAGPGPEGGVSYLYIGDIGDNFGIRGGLVTIYRVIEPDLPPGDGVATEVVPLPLRYSDGSSPNAEALFVDPVEGDLFIVTRDPESTRVYMAEANGNGAETESLDLIAEISLGGESVTAADVSWDGSVVALRGEDAIWLFHRPPEATIAEALQSEPCLAPSPDERQGEAIAFLSDGSLVTVSEGSNPQLNQVRRDG